MRQFFRPGLGAVLTVWLFAVAPFARGQEACEAPPPKGSHLFRHLLKLFKLQPLQSLEEFGRVPPAETLLIVFGETHALPMISLLRGGLDQFRKDGGAI